MNGTRRAPSRQNGVNALLWLKRCEYREMRVRWCRAEPNRIESVRENARDAAGMRETVPIKPV